MKKLILIFGLAILFVTCKKEHKLPPVKDPPPVSGAITIDSIVKKYISYYLPPAITPTAFFRFPDDVNLTCTVTADEISGNLYKQVFVQDATGGLEIKLLNAYGLNTGDIIRINLKGVKLSDYGDMVLLDSLNIDEKVVKISSGNTVNPIKLTFNQAQQMVAGMTKYQSRLVQFDSVEFIAADKAQTYADTSFYKYTLERTIMNFAGETMVVRTSGYSNFAKNLTPCGKGSIVAILGQYGSALQLTLRKVSDVNLASGGCPTQVKNFNDNSVTSGGWTNFRVNGGIDWTVASYNGALYGNITNYVGGSNQLCETWLISPSYNLTNANNPRFQFQSAYNYTGPILQVMVSTNYTSGDPSLATWTALSPTLSPGSWSWTGSGNVSLNSYKTANTRIAFKYSGTATSGSTWEVDDIAVFAD